MISSAKPEPVLRQCPVLILAGGLGTRLRSVLEDEPKVMAPINSVPFLGYLLKSLAVAGFHEVVLCVRYRSEEIEQWLGDGSQFGLSISYSREKDPLGTGGALRLASQRFAAHRRFFAMNGDSLLQLDFQAMLRCHVKTRAVATIALAKVPDISRYGAVEFDHSRRVKVFQEKQAQHTPGYINGGIYLFEPSVMDLVPDGRAVSLEREVLPALISQELRAFRTSGYFIDIGIPEDFFRAQNELKGLEFWP